MRRRQLRTVAPFEWIIYPASSTTPAVATCLTALVLMVRCIGTQVAAQMPPPRAFPMAWSGSLTSEFLDHWVYPTCEVPPTRSRHREKLCSCPVPLRFEGVDDRCRNETLRTKLQVVVVTCHHVEVASLLVLDWRPCLLVTTSSGWSGTSVSRNEGLIHWEPN